MNLIHKLLFATITALALSSCAALPEPSNYNKIWAETQTCTGLTASKPEAVVVPDIFWDIAKNGNYGYYNYNTNIIMIKENDQRNRKLVAHEQIHHLIYINYGSEDRNHLNKLFKQCRYAN